MVFVEVLSLSLAGDGGGIGSGSGGVGGGFMVMRGGGWTVSKRKFEIWVLVCLDAQCKRLLTNTANIFSQE